MVDVPCHGVEGRWPRKKVKKKEKKKGIGYRENTGNIDGR